MRKKFMNLLALIGVLALFTACSSDDKNVTPENIEFAGFYKGDIVVNLDETTFPAIPGKIEIIGKGEGKATLQLRNFKFGPLVIGDIIVDNVAVTTKNETVYLNGEEKLTLVVGECDVDVEATIANKKMEALINVVAHTPITEEDPVSQTLNITVKFNGDYTTEGYSNEAKLLTFGLKDISTTSSIDGEAVTLNVKYSDKEKLNNALPVVTISENAKISPAIDKEQDFTQPVVYTVTAEDGITTTKYTVTTNVNPLESVVSFDFTTPILDTYKRDDAENHSALPETKAQFVWGASDGGLEMVMGFDDTTKLFGVTHIEKDDEFNAPVFSLKSQDTKGVAPLFGSLPAVPKITSGSMFLGLFKLNAFNPLASTQFGVIVEQKALAVSGIASYKSGPKYYECLDPTPQKSHLAELVEGKKDTGIISAVVYEIENDEDTLNGTNLYTSDKIIGIGKLEFADGFKGDFTFDIKYTKDFDINKKYKLALVLSASKDGDKFSGAGDSTLKLAKLELGFE